MRKDYPAKGRDVALSQEDLLRSACPIMEYNSVCSHQNTNKTKNSQSLKINPYGKIIMGGQVLLEAIQIFYTSYGRALDQIITPT